MQNTSYILALLITALGIVLISIESLLIKITSISGATYAFYIGILMFLSLNTVLLKDGFNHTKRIYRDNIKVILVTGILTAFANIFFINSIKYTAIANTVIIISSSPFFTTLFAYIFFKEKPQKNIFIASFFIFMGLLIIFSQQLAGSNLLGDILALLCAVSFSLCFVVMSRYKNVNRFAVLAFAGLCITVLSLFIVDNFTLNTTSIYILLIAGLLVSPFSRVFVLIGIKTLPANEVALLTILETVLAPIWAWIFLNEIPVINTVVGGFIILATLVINALYLIKVSKANKKIQTYLNNC